MRRAPGEHAPNCKNRSSKQLGWFTKIKPIYRCLNKDELKKMSSSGNPFATKEINRRAKKHEKAVS